MENRDSEIALLGDPKELDKELKILKDLNIIKYKIINKDSFTSQFTDDFLTFSRVFKDKLIENSKLTAMEVLKKFPKITFTEDKMITVYYTTVLYDWIIATKQDNKIDITDEYVMGGIAARIEEINESVRSLKYDKGSMVN